MKEIWMPIAIKGYEDRYEVSSIGRVRSTGSKQIMKPYSSWDRGTRRISIYQADSSKKQFRVSVLVASAFIPNPNSYKYVVHKDGNVDNNRIDNLVWCEKRLKLIKDEIWKPVAIEKYQDQYEVSSLGRVRRKLKNGWHILSPIFSDNFKKLVYHLKNSETGITIRLEQIVAYTFFGSDGEIQFIDGNPYNCAVYNMNVDGKSYDPKQDKKQSALLCPNNRNRGRKGKTVSVFKDGVYLKTFSKAIDAAKFASVNYVFVSACINGKIPSYKGYSFKVIT